MRRGALGVVAIAACFTGDSAQGLPCTADEFCAGLRCIDGFCGGPPDGVDPTSATVATSGPTTSTTATTSTTEPTSTTATTTEPTSTTDVDTTSSETTGPALPCVPMGSWSALSFERAPEDQFSSSGRPLEMVVADLDDDGFPDLVTANLSPNELELRRGTSDGSFSLEQPYTRALAGQTDELIAGSIDDEGDQDLVVVYAGDNLLSILLWDELGASYEAVSGSTLPTEPSPRRPVITNIDGSGLPDVVYATAEGLGAFTAITSDGAMPSSLSLDDQFADDLIAVSYDGDVALVTANLANDRVFLYRVNFTDGELLELRSAEVVDPTHVAAVDFDQDGDADDDVVVVGDDGNVWLLPHFLGPEPGEIVPLGSFADFGAPQRIALGQLDGECGLDLAVLAHSDVIDRDVILMRYEGGALSEGFVLGASPINAIQVFDLEDDGTAELVLASDEAFVQIARYLP